MDMEISLIENLISSIIQSDDSLLDGEYDYNREKSCLSLLLKIMDDICIQTPFLHSLHINYVTKFISTFDYYFS